MAIRIEHVGDVAIVNADGMFTGGEETTEFATALRSLIDGNEQKILLDLSETRLMLSLAIGALVDSHVRAAERGVLFYVCETRPALKKVFETIQIQSQLLHYFDSRDEALKALQKHESQ